MPRLFVFGLGFSALALGRQLLQDGWQVAGTCRSADKQERLRAEGFDLWRMSDEAPLTDATAALAGSSHLLISIPPDSDGDPVLRAHGEAIAALSREARPPRWLGYLSTTGVYGDHDGGWVDETSPVTPNTERGARRVAAEAGWLELGRRCGLPVHLFRLSGIYGPGRSALETVRAGRARRIDKPGQVFNRIHVADIAATLRASIDRPAAGQAYNLADDDPAPPQDVIAHACRLLGVPVPPAIPFEDAELSPMARSFYADNKRVRNDRIKQDLGVRLAFPSYRDGLAAQLLAETASG